MREFTDEEGDTLLDFVRDVMSTSHRGDPHILRAKAAILDKALKWGIGLPNNQAKDGGHNTVEILLRNPARCCRR